MLSFQLLAWNAFHVSFSARGFVDEYSRMDISYQGQAMPRLRQARLVRMVSEGHVEV